MRVLVIGATGYLGGSVARRLKRGGLDVAGLVRNAPGAKLLEGAGIAAVDGSLDDPASLRAAVAGFDVVIQAADSDHLAATVTLLSALGGTGKAFIHTSGISVTADRAAGRFAGTILAEDSAYQPIAERARRFAIDQIVRAAGDAKLRAMVMCCPLVYGPGPWPGRESVQLPTLIADARANGAARHVAAGLARWSHAHVDDVADAFAAALERGQPGALYYPEAGEVSWGGIAGLIAARLGLPVRAITLEAAIAAWGPRALWTYCSNARTRGIAIRRDLAWSPRIADGLAAEIERLT